MCFEHSWKKLKSNHQNVCVYKYTLFISNIYKSTCVWHVLHDVVKLSLWRSRKVKKRKLFQYMMDVIKLWCIYAYALTHTHIHYTYMYKNMLLKMNQSLAHWKFQTKKNSFVSNFKEPAAQFYSRSPLSMLLSIDFLLILARIQIDLNTPSDFLTTHLNHQKRMFLCIVHCPESWFEISDLYWKQFEGKYVLDMHSLGHVLSSVRFYLFLILETYTRFLFWSKRNRISASDLQFNVIPFIAKRIW